ncbi:MAG: hypothetical protein LEGION0403_FIIPPAGN_00653 [Legionella sp.]|uniref:hypothetical protein n=1 Tax=Legionella sp. TaxID=459 RepID=UPI003D0AAC6D
MLADITLKCYQDQEWITNPYYDFEKHPEARTPFSDEFTHPNFNPIENLALCIGTRAEKLLQAINQEGNQQVLAEINLWAMQKQGLKDTAAPIP